MNTTFSYQLCQDKELTEKFRELHKELVEKIITFCHENDLRISEMNLSADGMIDSIKENKWLPSTDSSMSLTVGKEEKPFLWSI